MFFPKKGVDVSIAGWDLEKLTEEIKILTEESKILTEESKILTEEIKFLTEEFQRQPPALRIDALACLDESSLCFPPGCYNDTLSLPTISIQYSEKNAGKHCRRIEMWWGGYVAT